MAEENKKEDATKKEDAAKKDANKKEDEKQKAAKTHSFEGDGNPEDWKTLEEVALPQLGELEVLSIIGNSKLLKARQHLLDIKKYKRTHKSSNPGKMPFNNDPYPVDLKIEELEFHHPNIKEYTNTTHVHGQDAMKCAMRVSDRSEKRIVKLENMVATLFRYFFRLGSRIQIGCQYWGGITPFEKYCAIRCLHDDRINDGQLVQIDQCLTCTRFEPIYGQVYECLNDLGANVAAILDDNQASYSNMLDYVTLNRAERFGTAKEKAIIDLSLITKRDGDEKDFKDIWGPGLKMNWDLIPKEQQKTHINWRQSINDDGSGLMRLSSFVGGIGNSGMNAIGNTADAEIMKNISAMDSYSGGDSFVQARINEGKSEAGNVDDFYNKIKAGLQKDVASVIGPDYNVDSAFIAAIAYILNISGAEAANKYKSMASAIGTKNSVLIVTAMGCGEKFILGDGGSIPRIDMVNVSDKDEPGGKDKIVRLDWGRKESWLYPEVAVNFAKQCQNTGVSASATALYPRACYLYKAVIPKLRSSPYDSDKYAFPFSSKELRETEIYYTSPFGPRTLNGETRMHRGIDIGANAGTPFRSVADGVVTGAGHGWGEACNAINIQHRDGTYSRYLHCQSINVSVGQAVTKGQVIGTVGDTGSPGAYHLHFEMDHGEAELTTSSHDPLSFFPKFNISKDQRIEP